MSVALGEAIEDPPVVATVGFVQAALTSLWGGTALRRGKAELLA
ncbi:hypothetical protein [Nocardia sp. NPDC023988]